MDYRCIIMQVRQIVKEKMAIPYCLILIYWPRTARLLSASDGLDALLAPVMRLCECGAGVEGVMREDFENVQVTVTAMACVYVNRNLLHPFTLALVSALTD